LACDRHAFTYDYEILSGVYLCALFFGVFFSLWRWFFFFFFFFLVLVLVLRAGLALFWGFLDTYLYFQAQLWVDTRARGKLFSIQKGEFRKSSRLDTHLSTTINYPQPSSLTARGNCAAWGTQWEVENRRDCARACPSTERRKRLLMYKANQANLRSPGADPSGAHRPGGWSSSVETK
jgi:hypothetical protein